MSLPTPSFPLVLAFALLAVVVGGAFPLLLYRAERSEGRERAPATRRALIAAAGVAAWMALTGIAAATGWLSFAAPLPRAMLLFPLVGALGFTIGCSRIGGRLAAGVPLALLVGLQIFRLPLELAMHRAYTEGLMPVQMSYSGFNLDIVTGAGALLLVPLILAGRAPRGLVLGWNVLGTLLLLNIIVLSALSTPTPLRRFATEPANEFVTHVPFVWLPAVLVVTAIWGHIVIYRALRSWDRLGAPGPGDTG